MGLLRFAGHAIGAGAGALNNVAESVWSDYFESGDMSGGILMKRGEKIVPGKSKNIYGDVNLITSGSGIDVQENQCMIILENGRVVEFCAEPGRYTYDSSTMPSLFHGENQGLKALGNEILNQWSAGGQRKSTQRVFFINMAPQLGYKWGSGNISFNHVERDLNGNPVWQRATTLMGNGTYAIRISDPQKFFVTFGGQVTGEDGNGIITAETIDLDSQFKAKVIGQIRQAIGGLNRLKIPYTEIVNHEQDIIEALNKLLAEDWSGLCGIEICDFNIRMIDPDETSKKAITEYQDTVGYASNPSMLAANLGRGTIEAMKAAGENGNGAVGGIMGVGMMGNMMGNMGISQMMQQGTPTAQSQPSPQQTEPPKMWKCMCGSENTSNFCTNCGKPKPNFKCDKCGWKPAAGEKLPKFCPNCGDRFDENDLVQ